MLMRNVETRKTQFCRTRVFVKTHKLLYDNGLWNRQIWQNQLFPAKLSNRFLVNFPQTF